MVYSASKIPTHFTDIIDAVREQKLTELNLSVPPGTKDDDKLHHIPLEVLKFTWLKKLDLTGNNLYYLPESLRNLRNLTNLDLRNNDIDINDVPESIGNLNNFASEIKLKIIKIFLASDSELASDRQEFKIFISDQNNYYVPKNIYLQLISKEKISHAISRTRKQDEYNKAAKNSDIFVGLFYTRIDNSTEEEFKESLKSFKDNDRPLIFIHFKNEEINISDIPLDIRRILKFKQELEDLGGYAINYDHISDLKYKFSEQLRQKIPQLTDIPANEIE